MGSHTRVYGCVPEYCEWQNLPFGKTNSSGYFVIDNKVCWTKFLENIKIQNTLKNQYFGYSGRNECNP